MIWQGLAVMALLALAAAGVYAAFVWTRRHLYTRERFAFVGLSVAASATLLMGTAVVGGVTPWQVAAVYLGPVFGVDPGLMVPSTD